MSTGKRRRLAWFLAVGGALAAAAPTRADEAVTDMAARIQRLREYMRRCEAFGFSGALLVAEGDRTLLHEGYGMADRARGIRVTSATAFPVASITKPITATAILKLQDLGLLSVNDRLTDHLADVPKDKAAITIHQLLTHTSGLAHDYQGDADESFEEAVRGMLATPLEYEPGAPWAYSNLGYGLLAAIVTRVSGRPHEQFVAEHVFAPAGMRNSGFLGDHDRWADGQVAHTYNRDRDAGSPTQWKLTLQGKGAGALITSAGDLLAFWQALHDGRLIDTRSVATAVAPHAGVKTDWTYGYGWHLFKTEHGRVIYHGGNRSPDGVTAEFRHYPDRGVTTILTVNVMQDQTGYNRAVRDAVAAILFGGDYEEPPSFVHVEPGTLSALVGRYPVTKTASVTVRNERDQLILSAEGQAAIDRVLPYDQLAPAALKQCNEKVHKIATDVCAGKLTEIPREDWLGAITPLHECKGFDVLGTVLSGQEHETRVTFVRVHDAVRSTGVRFISTDDAEEDGFYVMDGSPSIDLFRLMPTSTDEFVGYDLLTHDTIRVMFRKIDHEARIALTVRLKNHEDVLIREN